MKKPEAKSRDAVPLKLFDFIMPSVRYFKKEVHLHVTFRTCVPGCAAGGGTVVLVSADLEYSPFPISCRK
jgi:hypothetical protein